jgi:hypothetical protein
MIYNQSVQYVKSDDFELYTVNLLTVNLFSNLL